MKKLNLLFVLAICVNTAFSQAPTLSNFGITKLEIKGDKIAIQAKTVKVNKIALNLNKTVITRKVVDSSVVFTFSSLKNLTITLSPKKGIKIVDGRITSLINEKANIILQPATSVYLLLLVKIEQRLNAGLRSVKDQVIPIKPLAGNELIVLGCWGVGGTRAASEARSGACMKGKEFARCAFLGLDTSCLWENLACMSVATFDCP